MKKLLKFALAMFLVFNSFLSLSVKALTKDEFEDKVSNLPETTITVWLVHGLDGGLGEYYQQVANKFMEEHPNIKLELSGGFGYDGMQEKLLTSNMAGNLPVLAQIEEAHISRLHPIAEDLNNYLSEETIDNYIDGLLNSSYIDERMVAVPAGRSMPVLYFNKDLFEASGLEKAPENWDELREYAKIITEKNEGVIGFGVLWDSDAWFWESAIYSWGGSITDESGKKVVFNDEGIGEKNVQMFQDMVKEGTAIHPFGLASAAGNNVTSGFVDGKLGMYINSSAGFGSLANNDTIPFEVGVATQPAGSEISITTGGNNWMMTNKGTEEEKIAGAAFLTYLASDEVSYNVFKMSGYMPSTESSLEYEPLKEMVTENPNYQVIIDSLQYAHARPQSGSWREMYTYITPKLEEAMMKPDEIDVKAMVEEMVIQCQSILDAYNIGLE